MDIEQYMDPELKEVFLKIPKRSDALLNLSQIDWTAARKLTSQDKAIQEKIAWQLRPKSENITVENRYIPGTTGSPLVSVRIYQPVIRTQNLPGLLYIHGGGFTNGDQLQDFDSQCWRIVENVGCVVVSVGYRLAPENPFPASLDDCYAVIQWMASGQSNLGIDTAKLAVAGVSAGGCLAAAVALLCRDRKDVQLVFQLLLMPCLDDRHITPSSYAITDIRIWNRAKSLRGWEAYLGKDFRGKVSPYAAPARMENLVGLPPTCIIVGELDLLRDENIDYASRLMQAGTSTELHVVPGAFHGFMHKAPQAGVSVRIVSEYLGVLKRALNH
jgi:acetyl esterase/lipase